MCACVIIVATGRTSARTKVEHTNRLTLGETIGSTDGKTFFDKISPKKEISERKTVLCCRICGPLIFAKKCAYISGNEGLNLHSRPQ